MAGLPSALLVFLMSMSPAQQPALHVQTDLVVVPFQVRRGSRSVSDLKSTDVVLLEDGVPRAFTGFEAPPDHPSLDLAVMFDVTDVQRGGFWNAKALHDMVSYWDEKGARALLEESGATIRISVYQFDQSRLRRLSSSTSDPKEFLAALDRLADPIPAGQGFDLRLPDGVVIRPEATEAERKGGSPWSRSLLGAMTLLGESASGPAMPRRAMVIFSPGQEATSITPEDLADQGVAANVPIYPVALPANHSIWYEGDSRGNYATFSPDGQWLQAGLCTAPALERPEFRGFIECPLNKRFGSIGRQTGGRSFEAARRQQTQRDPEGPGRFSMTGRQVNDILEAAKRHALARFTSSYTLWFAPSPSTSPRKHKLEVKLAPKVNGKLTDGKRTAAY